MAQAPTSSTSTSSTQVSSSSSSRAAAPVSKLSDAAQSIVDRLQQSQSVFVPKDDLSEADEDALEAAGYRVDPDAVRNGYFIARLSPSQLAERA